MDIMGMFFIFRVYTLLENLTEYIPKIASHISGQIPITPKPDCFGHFGGIPGSPTFGVTTRRNWSRFHRIQLDGFHSR